MTRFRRWTSFGLPMFAALLTMALSSSTAFATFPGANGRIAFGTGGDIATMEPDGSDVRVLHSGFDPAWSADGRWLAFDDSGDIFMMGANGSGVRRLTQTPQFDSWPAFSPGGGRIVFDRYTDRTGSHPAMISLETGRTHRLHGYIRRPDWAPNGRHIVFEYQQGEGLLTARPDGTHRRRITAGEDGDFYPSYSSSGHSIFFIRDVYQRFESPRVPPEQSMLMRVRPDGTHLHRVRAPAGFDEPAPAPEGGCVVGPAGDATVAVGAQCPFSKPIGFPAYFPSWQPIP
jgi:TolB protein